jgi:hypothetical protein
MPAVTAHVRLLFSSGSKPTRTNPHHSVLFLGVYTRPNHLNLWQSIWFEKPVETGNAQV